MPAVTELIVAELLYLQYKDRQKPIFLYINSTGTTRADGETVSTACAHGELAVMLAGALSICLQSSLMGAHPVDCVQVGFETEGTAIYDTMRFVRNEVGAPSIALVAACQTYVVPWIGQYDMLWSV